MQLTINPKDLVNVKSISIGLHNGKLSVDVDDGAAHTAEATLASDRFVPMAMPMEVLDHLTWDEIDRISRLPNVRDYLALGARKKDHMKNGFVAEWQIIGFDHDDLADGSGKACLSWDMVNVYKERVPMNDSCSNNGGWEACKLNRFANNDFLSQCSDALQAVIVPVVKLTSNGGENSKIIKSICKVWLKSEKELFGRCYYSAPGEGHWYEFYKQEDVPYYREDEDGDRCWQWLRSARQGSTSSFCAVNYSGTADGGVASYTGIYAPLCFCSGKRES